MSVKCLSCSRFVKGAEIAAGTALSKNIGGILSAICGPCKNHGITLSNYTDSKDVKKKFKTLLDISKNDFIKWLETKSPSKVIGSPRDNANCPIGSFFKETRDMLSVSVSEHDITVVPKSGLSHEIFPTKRWARDFTHVLDQEYGNTVTAKRCLEILESIERVDINEV
jgi:hypothetical protein